MAKVIAKITDEKYLIEVNHSELEKYLDLYYNNMKRLKVGEEVDLSKGYDWYHKTQDALKQTQKFFKANQENLEAITNAFLLKTIEVKETK